MRRALILNAMMCVIGLGAAYFAQSTGILADAIDMAADASGYALVLLAVGHNERFRALAARWTGTVLMVIGIGIIVEATQRWITGNEPFGPVMMAYSVVSFFVNLYVLQALAKIREGGVHLNASYICTRVDVLANLVVLIAGGIVWVTGTRWVDPVAGVAIALLVFSEAREILEGANESEAKSPYGGTPTATGFRCRFVQRRHGDGLVRFTSAWHVRLAGG
ncbi:MAG: cation diffusion facilitator family transporter [Gammaproteobacteria bacterium]